MGLGFMDCKTIEIENSIEELRAQLNSLVEENRQCEEVLNVSVELDNLINQFYRSIG
jgi:hypothetical protein